MRRIDADELYEKLDKIRKEEVALYGVGNSRFCCTLSTALTEINDAPTIEPERKKGKWIPQDHNKSNGMVPTLVSYYPKCSECGHSGNYTNFCPRCGADMRGDNDE